MEVIKGRIAIESAQTVQFPTSYEVNAHAQGYVKGYVSCFYTFSRGWVFCGHHDTLEEAVEQFYQYKEMCDMFPDMLNWMDVSDRVVFRDNGCDPRNPSNVRWYPCAMVVDE